jgi:hypothetical protein
VNVKLNIKSSWWIGLGPKWVLNDKLGVRGVNSRVLNTRCECTFSGYLYEAQKLLDWNSETRMYGIFVILRTEDLFAPFIIQWKWSQPLEVLWQLSVLHSFNFHPPPPIFRYSLLVASPRGSSISQTCGQRGDKSGDGCGPYSPTLIGLDYKGLIFFTFFSFSQVVFEVLVWGDNN